MNKILVYYHGNSKILVGTLALKDRKIYFEYDKDFLQTKLELSPFKLPLKPGLFTSQNSVFDGLFGVFNDSLPDGWGKLLLDRKLRKIGQMPGNLSPLDRLCYVGSHGLGALSYEPEIKQEHSVIHDLDEIADEIQVFEDGDDQFVDELYALNGSSAGARPKILVKVAKQDWIIKFRSIYDEKDIANIEYAYHLMAKSAGLDVPEAKLFPSNHGSGYFGVQRFDRVFEIEPESREIIADMGVKDHLKMKSRFHLHSISGLLHADHKIASLDYETIMKATTLLTKDMRQLEKQFRAAAFNVLSHNRDDHSKNFSFLMDKTGGWQVSPAYDLTFSFGPNGEHCTTIMGEGRNPDEKHLLQLATKCTIKKDVALKIIDEVKSAINNWNLFAEAAFVSRSSIEMIQKSLL